MLLELRAVRTLPAATDVRLHGKTAFYSLYGFRAPPPAGLNFSRMSYHRDQFSIASFQGPYPGLTDGSTWNGWACPVFERGAAEQVARDYLEVGKDFPQDGKFRAWYDAEEDCFWFYDPVNDDEVCYCAEVIEHEGATVTVYPIGTREWTWEKTIPTRD